jgi:uncharacterized MnhB-related membrane protein
MVVLAAKKLDQLCQILRFVITPVHLIPSIMNLFLVDELKAVVGAKVYLLVTTVLVTLLISSILLLTRSQILLDLPCLEIFVHFIVI